MRILPTCILLTAFRIHYTLFTEVALLLRVHDRYDDDIVFRLAFA